MSMSKSEALAAALSEPLGELIISSRLDRGELTIEVSADNLLALMGRLKTDAEFSFTQMSDLSGVDYLTYGEADWQTQSATDSGFSRGVAQGSIDTSGDDERRFAVTYQLLSIEHNHRLRVKVYLAGDPPRLPSVSALWPVADWYEREAFDLFGILFEDHPDLRRILTDYGFIGHPFRKDFPLEGEVEVRYDPDKGRVVNQPVTIEPRTLVPRVIREEDWLHSSKAVPVEPSENDA